MNTDPDKALCERLGVSREVLRACDGSVIDRAARFFAAPVIAVRHEQKKRGRPSKREEELRIKALVRNQLWDCPTYHYDPDAVFRPILRANPDLSPKARLTSQTTPEQSARKAYSKSVADANKREKARKAELDNTWRTFMAGLDDQTRDAMLRLPRWLRALLNAAGDDIETRRFAWRLWLAWAEARLPQSVFDDCVILITPVEVVDHLAGLYLQQEHERMPPARKPFYLHRT